LRVCSCSSPSLHLHSLWRSSIICYVTHTQAIMDPTGTLNIYTNVIISDLQKPYSRSCEQRNACSALVVWQPETSTSWWTAPWSLFQNPWRREAYKNCAGTVSYARSSVETKMVSSATVFQKVTCDECKSSARTPHARLMTIRHSLNETFYNTCSQRT